MLARIDALLLRLDPSCATASLPCCGIAGLGMAALHNFGAGNAECVKAMLGHCVRDVVDNVERVDRGRASNQPASGVPRTVRLAGIWPAIVTYAAAG